MSFSVRSRALHVVLACDADPDRPGYGGIPLNSREKHVWNGIERGIPKLLNALKEIIDHEGGLPRVTWFLRSDEQMNELYGDHCWPAVGFRQIWDDLVERKHEIGWHPHLWGWSEKHGTWYQEINDNEWIRKCLIDGFSSLNREFKIGTVRTGWDYHNNLTMKTLEDLGIKADLSALPGFENTSYVDNNRNLIQNRYDWIGAPEVPYRPSSTDYRAIGNMSIIEIPHACFHQSYLVYALRKAFWKAFSRRPGKQPLQRFPVTASMNPSHFLDGIKQAFKKSKSRNPIFVSYFHPDDLIVDKNQASFSNLVTNILAIRATSKRLNIPFKFVTAAEAAEMAKEYLANEKR
jgi:hypothetical protein